MDNVVRCLICHCKPYLSVLKFLDTVFRISFRFIYYNEKVISEISELSDGADITEFWHENSENFYDNIHIFSSSGISINFCSVYTLSGGPVMNWKFSPSTTKVYFSLLFQFWFFLYYLEIMWFSAFFFTKCEVAGLFAGTVVQRT